jgi:phospholipase C
MPRFQVAFPGQGRLAADQDTGTGRPVASGKGLRMRMKRRRLQVAASLAAALLVAAGLAACTSGSRAWPAARGEVAAGGLSGHYLVPAGIHKIKHVIIVMQENRSFDSYFGTYPGADGIPMKDGKPTVCVPNAAGGCTRPYHDTADRNGGGPHGEGNAIADVADGKMNGFIRQQALARKGCHVLADPACSSSRTPDVMGYHTAAEIPNYWTYAKDFVLDDHMFEPVKTWSLADHLYMVSAWSAKCRNRSPMSCKTDIVGPYQVTSFDNAVAQELATGQTSIDFAWTDITYLLHEHHVSWAYYVQAGTQPDCDNDSAETCAAVKQNVQTLGIWNPLPMFTDVQQDHQLGNIRSLDAYFNAAKTGALPAVSWITPSGADSDHPPASIHRGQAYVTAIINAAMKSPDWDSTAIFLAWDDWGGFYDHVVPPAVDQEGYGLRVPAITISPTPRSGTSTTRRSAAMPTSSSSRTTSWAAPGSTPGPTAAPIRGPTSGKTSRSWGTWLPTSTSARNPGPPCSCPPTRRPTRP